MYLTVVLAGIFAFLAADTFYLAGNPSVMRIELSDTMANLGFLSTAGITFINSAFIVDQYKAHKRLQENTGFYD